MNSRQILRLPPPQAAQRKLGSRRNLPRPPTHSRSRQSGLFGSAFDALATGLQAQEPTLSLSADPTGIAPERALVFVASGTIDGFARVCALVGLELVGEFGGDSHSRSGSSAQLPRSATLYATVPTLDALKQLLSLWRSFCNGEGPPDGLTPWWKLFSQLEDLRIWGPQDRFTDDAREELLDRLQYSAEADVAIEIEMWPSLSSIRQNEWHSKTVREIESVGGHVVHTSSISGAGFAYHGILAKIPVEVAMKMVDNEPPFNGLVRLDGIQFIFPQTIAQANPLEYRVAQTMTRKSTTSFDENAPFRAVLLDGFPVAAHPMIDGGIGVEDLHDLEARSIVAHRRHATSMASLILRGDLGAEQEALGDSRVLSVPLLVDGSDGANAPTEKLFVDVVHQTLVRLIDGDKALTPDTFVINFSIGIRESHFAGRISALARLLDWWSAKAGVLFVVSAGNVLEPFLVSGVPESVLQEAEPEQRRAAIVSALKAERHSRTLLAPAEALNALTVGSASHDVGGGTISRPGFVALEDDGRIGPAVTSAVGPGPFRSIKPDVLTSGGVQEVRILPHLRESKVHPVLSSPTSGLVAADPTGGMCRVRGTSCAAALTTRAILQCAEALVTDGGPYEGMELPRRDLALLTRALAVNAAVWPALALDQYQEEKKAAYHLTAKEEVARSFGYGVLDSSRMHQAPELGATLVALGTVQKDRAAIFQMPLPPSLSSDSVGRTLRVTIAWFSPVEMLRQKYRLASLEAISSADDDDVDAAWRLALKTDMLDEKMIKRGTVWSRRLTHHTKKCPEFSSGYSIPIRVQCRDASGGGLDRDEEIRFAIVVTLEVENAGRYDVYEEIRQQLRVPIRGGHA